MSRRLIERPPGRDMVLSLIGKVGDMPASHYFTVSDDRLPNNIGPPRDGDLCFRDDHFVVHPSTILPMTPSSSDYCVFGSYCKPVGCYTNSPLKCVVIPKEITQMHHFSVFAGWVAYFRWAKDFETIFELRGDHPLLEVLMDGKMDPKWTVYVKTKSDFLVVLFSPSTKYRPAQYESFPCPWVAQDIHEKANSMLCVQSAIIVTLNRPGSCAKLQRFWHGHKLNARQMVMHGPLASRDAQVAAIRKWFSKQRPQCRLLPPDRRLGTHGMVCWARHAEYRWPKAYIDMRELAMVLEAFLGDESYVILFIIDWLPGMLQWYERGKIRCIQSVLQSISRIREHRAMKVVLHTK